MSCDNCPNQGNAGMPQFLADFPVDLALSVLVTVSSAIPFIIPCMISS